MLASLVKGKPKRWWGGGVLSFECGIIFAFFGHYGVISPEQKYMFDEKSLSNGVNIEKFP